ncbi:glycoside hydrolase family 97 catalytic domain-containing protein [Mucilaginibacter litoreus]|uniref:Glycoside hydrolase family 97 catalytic domain-containing protein n=1 Tax=Mucilaginibacter litoreus TaxID=1048221 RepID=A0ABW3AS00_9SPHI
MIYCLKVFAAISLIIFFNGQAQAQQKASEWKVISPSGALQINLKLNNGALSYSVTDKGEVIVKPSKLGIESTTEKFSDHLSFANVLTRPVSEIYVLPTGKYSVYKAKANQASVTFTNSYSAKMTVDLRAYDDGIAFRYRFPDSAKTYTLVNESTEFAVPQASAWMQQYGNDPAYENVFKNGIPAGTAAPDSTGWAFPALFHTKDHWLFLSESNISPDNAGMHLQPMCSNGIYKIAFPLKGEGLGQGSSYPVAKAPFAMPWRVFIIGKNPSVVVQSALINHLSAPNTIGNIGWVKPGRSSWSWWSDHASSRNVTTLKRFVDLAANMKWEYSLVDANWNMLKDGGNIKDLIDYAKSKDVKLTFWYNSGGPHNNVGEQPRDIMFDSLKRKQELKKLHDWGVKAIKVDFFQSDKQNVMQLYQDILKDAAKEKIMVIFHGSTMPRGWARTYPNLLSMESVRGAENYGWSPEFAADAAVLNTIYVFTRNVAGSMDYTPVTFSDYQCCPHTTTNAHELALSVVFESGMMHFADSDSSYYKQSAEVKQFLSSVPNTWDDVKLLQGEPGKEAVLARRKGKDWYIAGINGETVAKNWQVFLSFLDVKKRYKAKLYVDGKSSREITYKELTAKTGDKVGVNVLPKGGFVLVLQP